MEDSKGKICCQDFKNIGNQGYTNTSILTLGWILKVDISFFLTTELVFTTSTNLFRNLTNTFLNAVVATDGIV